MSTLDWLAGLDPNGFSLVLEPNGRDFESPYTRSFQGVDLLGERWRAVIALPPCYHHDAPAREVLFNCLAQRANTVRLWHMARPEPRGTLRGAPVLAAAALQGAASLSLTNCTGTKVWTGGSFEFDSNADGLADGLVATQNGSLGTVTYSRDINGIVGPYRQRVDCTAFGTSVNDWVRFDGGAPVAAGGSHTSSVWVIGSTGAHAVLSIDADGAGGGSVSAELVLTGVWQRLAVTCPTPNSANLTARVWVRQASTAGPLAFALDGWQLERGTVAHDWTPTTLRTGDLLGLGADQLLQVADDCTADDAGRMTVPLVNRVRVAQPAGASVGWLRPSAVFRLPAGTVPVTYEQVIAQGGQLELVEHWT